MLHEGLAPGERGLHRWSASWRNAALGFAAVIVLDKAVELVVRS